VPEGGSLLLSQSRNSTAIFPESINRIIFFALFLSAVMFWILIQETLFSMLIMLEPIKEKGVRDEIRGKGNIS
jgi:hypothetical protein